MSKLLEACMRFVDTEPYEIIRISEMRGDGGIETADREKTNFCQDIYSGAKVFTMTAIGLLCDRGALRLEDKIADLFADELPAGTDERWALATVEMAVKHRLGLPGGFLDIDCASVRDFGFDFLKYLFTYPLQYTPGAEERYADGSTYLLSRVVTKVTGEKLDDFLWRELFWKLGFQEAAWSRCPMGYPIGATGLYINSRDMVKLPYLYLKNGVWQGERLLSEAWVQAVLSREYVFEWDLTGRWFFKGGMYGQKMIGLPYQARAVAFQAYGANSDRLARFIAAFED
jgi:CubicO group peptidase (beta-lactamase class C family)